VASPVTGTRCHDVAMFIMMDVMKIGVVGHKKRFFFLYVYPRESRGTLFENNSIFPTKYPQLFAYLNES